MGRGLCLLGGASAFALGGALLSLWVALPCSFGEDGAGSYQRKVAGRLSPERGIFAGRFAESREVLSVLD